MEIDPNMVDQEGQPGAVDAAELLAAAPPAVNAHVSLDAETGLVRLDFSMPTRGISMDAEGARAMATALRQYANDSDRARGARRDRPVRRRW